MTVRPFFRRKVVCGIETWLTRVGIGTDCAGAASAGDASIVADASRTRLRVMRISLNSPVILRPLGGATLAAAHGNATAASSHVDFWAGGLIGGRQNPHIHFRYGLPVLHLGLTTCLGLGHFCSRSINFRGNSPRATKVGAKPQVKKQLTNRNSYDLTGS